METGKKIFYLSPDTGKESGNISTPALDISGKSWDWGSFPFLRASKLEKSRSGILVKLLLTKT